MKKLSGFFILLYATLLCATLPSLGFAHDICIIVNKNSPIKKLTEQQVIDLYLGRMQYFPDGRMAVKIDAPNNSELRKSFYSNLVNMSAAEANAYWARLLFSGRAAPPMPVSDDSEIILLVETNPNAIGYVADSTGSTDKVKIVAKIHTPDVL